MPTSQCQCCNDAVAPMLQLGSLHRQLAQRQLAERSGLPCRVCSSSDARARSQCCLLCPISRLPGKFSPPFHYHDQPPTYAPTHPPTTAPRSLRFARPGTDLERQVKLEAELESILHHIADMRKLLE